MFAMFELWAQIDETGETKTYEVFAESFSDACTKLINAYPGIIKITNPSVYGYNGGV